MAESITRLHALRVTRAKATALVRTCDQIVGRPGAWVAACIGVLALQALLIFTHEPWLDEYQAIMLAVQAPDIPTLFHWLSYEGHPPLWYLILRGLAYFADPLVALKLAAFGCALGLQLALLLASPFTRSERLLIATSEFVLFEFLTVSRSISLGAALMISSMTLWNRRSFWVTVALLPMCDFMFGLLSFALVAMKWRERGLWWPGVALWLAVGGLAAWTLIPAPDIDPALKAGKFADEFFYWLLSMSTLAFPFQGYATPTWNQPPFWLIATWAWVVFLLFAWSQTANDRFYRALLIGLTVFTLAFATLVYRLSPRHLMLIGLLLIVLVWRLRARGAVPRPAFRLWLLVVSACGLATAVINLTVPFDTADRAATKIRQLGLSQKHWLVFPVSEATGISAINDMSFERDGLHCMQTLIRWNDRSKINTYAQLLSYLSEEVKNHGKSYLVTPLDLHLAPQDLLRQLAHIPAGYDGHGYYLYVLGPSEPDRRISLPRCVPEEGHFGNPGMRLPPFKEK